MSKTPFMPLWNGDFLADTLELDATEIGAYILLIMAQWQRKGRSLPADDKRLQRVARCGRSWPKVWANIARFFDADDDGIYSARCRELFQNAAAKSQVNSQNGARGGAAKALKTQKPPVATATVSPQRKPSIPEPDTREEEEEAIASSKKSGSASLTDDVAALVGGGNWAKRELADCITIWLALGLKPAEIIEAAGSIEGPLNGPRDLDPVMSAAATAKRRPKPKADPKGTRMTQDWTLPREWGRWAYDQKMTVEAIKQQAERFKDYWLGVPGKAGLKLDWEATWRNWIRRELEKTEKGYRNGKPVGPDQRIPEGGKRIDPALANIARLAGLEEAPGDGGVRAGGSGDEARQIRLGEGPGNPDTGPPDPGLDGYAPRLPLG